MNCLLGDAGIAIGLTSLPFRQETKFYQNELHDSLFPNYKRAVLENFSANDTGSGFASEFRESFYKPVPYYLFGSFDLAVLTLVDDFEMMARTFRAFDPMLSSAQNKSYPENFFYKVITGPTPQFKRDDSIVKLAAQTFLKEDRLPLFAMSLLKLNNALLLGAGTELLRLVIRFINAIAKRQAAANGKVQAILLESYSANEITLLVFTSSYSAAAKLITFIREARLRDLLEAGSSVLRADESPVYLQHCLLTELITGQGKDIDVLNASLFIDTESYFGFDFRLLDPAQRALLERIDSNDTMDLFCQWSVRPGHLGSSIEELGQRNQSEVATCVGRGDLFEQARNLTTRQMIQQVLASLDAESLPRHAKRRQTMPAMAGGVVQSLTLERTNGEYVEADLSLMSFTVEEITAIQDRLRAVWAPKILTAKVLNAFTNYNDGILDPALYGYFVELLPLMKLIQQTVFDWYEAPQKVDLGLVCATLEKVTDNFERAYRNRFYNSYRMGDITDFNLDFKGGIQQLITSFDAAYKAICSELGRPESFVYVAGSPGVYSTRYEVRLNYYHVFQPEIFASIVNHEAANFYFTRFVGQPLPPFATATELAIDPHQRRSSKAPDTILARLDKLRNWHLGEQRILLPYITKALFKYVFVDLLALYFGYNRNGNLFTYWYWGYFAQTSHAYSREGTVDEIQLVTFMLRMRWIQRISRVQAADVSFGMKSFDDLYRDWKPIIDQFLEWLWARTDLNRWNNEVLSYVESKFRRIYRLTEDETVQQISERLEKEAGILRAKIERGETCLYSRVDERSMFKFTEQIFYAYLSLLADRFGKGDILLDRCKDGHPQVRPHHAKALFDPIGGIFTHDPVTRRERFRYRSSLTMSLWDMAQKEKKEVVRKQLRRAV